MLLRQKSAGRVVELDAAALREAVARDALAAVHDVQPAAKYHIAAKSSVIRIEYRCITAASESASADVQAAEA